MSDAPDGSATDPSPLASEPASASGPTARAGSGAGHHRRRLDVFVGLGAMVGIVACCLVARTGVPGWEQAIFHAINDLPDALQPVMWTGQLGGLLLLPLVVALGALLARRWRLALALVLLVPLKLLVELHVIKKIVVRDRPAESICAGDLTCGNFRDVPLAYASFPSGHAVIAFGLAWLLLPYVPRRWRWVPWSAAVFVAVSRVYLGAHNPLDVVCGACAGLLVASLLNLAVGVPRRSEA